MPDIYKYIYCDGRGRGELIRYIFAQANVPYEEVIIKAAEWVNEKPKMLFGVIPVLEVNGKALGQSTTIQRYLANKYGLAGNDEWTKASADMLAQSIEDIYVNYKPYIVASMKNDEALMVETKKVLMNETLRPLFERYEKFLGNKMFFVGDQLTFADLAIAELSDRIEKLFEKDFTVAYPNIRSHMLRIHELPNIKKYVQNRPTERELKG